MAANTDKFKKKRSNFSTTLNGGIGSGDATIALSSTSGLPTDTAVLLTVDRVDANATSTPTKMERVIGVVSGSSLINCLRGQDNSPSAQAHASGAVVEDIWDALSWNDALSGILVEHNQDGTHLNTVVALLAGTQTFTGNKTFSGNVIIASGKLLATRPQITTSIDDANGNQMVIYSATTNAVNQVTLTNAAAGNNPLLQASGNDTNIALNLKGKGSKGVVPLNSLAPTVATLTDASTIATDASLGNVFTVTIGASRTMGAPTNPTDGQVVTYVITQGGAGSFTITWNSAFQFGTSGAPTLTTTAGKKDYVTFRYDAAASKWQYMGSQLGF